MVSYGGAPGDGPENRPVLEPDRAVWLCPRCAWGRTGAYGGRCRNAFSDECQTIGAFSKLERVEMVPRGAAEALARAVSESLAHGEESPLATALKVYLRDHPWSDL